ncbi:hypothetical protein [Desulfobacula toluolica]|uniref:Uncharacterized protein n=1 Tax=Desulfobacula toluolica (strain DSM 7467 / Tol2) TaxID=651182 RepID=K0NIJ0_DESTT|nr:hypothetical protein [Desulfobacula toluolica]CCK81226.1 uncharacterized protein TOL2_C30690 [Desulfobacula toluolica Tol2]
MSPKHSYKDNRGRPMVACSECDRGGNGDQSCSCGLKVKTGKNGGCYLGVLLPKYDQNKVNQL